MKPHAISNMVNRNNIFTKDNLMMVSVLVIDTIPAGKLG
jgi:hypothetical protein